MIRLLRDDDDLDALTEMLHAAYRPLADLGLNYTATDQDVQTTRSRVHVGETWVAELDGRVVGTVTLKESNPEEPNWYGRPDVAAFEQFGVDPAVQGQGIGKQLLEKIERRAREKGYAELACDTAQPARHLIALYEKWGYRVVDEIRYEGKTYPSFILSKALAAIPQ